MARLLLLFILVPLAELALLIQMGRIVGVVATVALVVFTGALGAYLARRQGVGVLRQIRAEMGEGRIPAGPVMDGVLILLAAAVLMTPGVLTDVLGFLCLIPACRRRIKEHLRGWLERAVRRSDFIVSVGFGGAETRFHRPDLRNVTPRQESAEPASGPRPQLEEPGSGNGS